MDAAELVKKLPGAFLPEVADGAKAVFQFSITNPCYLKIGDGKCEFHSGLAETPDLTMISSDDVLIKVLKGQLNGMMAVMTGKLKTKGNLLLGQKMTSFFDMSKV